MDDILGLGVFNISTDLPSWTRTSDHNAMDEPPEGKPYCRYNIGGHDPNDFFQDWADGELGPPKGNDLRSAIQVAFKFDPRGDDYIYYATLEVTLDQAQDGINLGPQYGLHAWYRDEEGKVVSRVYRLDVVLQANTCNQFPPPSSADIKAYTDVFLPTTSTTKALTALASNAKKDSVRASVAGHLLKHRLFPSNLPIPKLQKVRHINPYLDFWAWSCHNLEWSGPDESTVRVKQSHYILPIFYHHFGCVCPSFEALETIKLIAKKRSVLDIGSGPGYWTYMLRRHGVTTRAVDNGDSLWRCMWIGDTIKADGARYLKHDTEYISEGGGNGGKDSVLLLVYPQVTTKFTTAVLDAYQGTTIVVAGTQNRNGFTGFKGRTIAEWMEKNMPGWERIVQTPLPSFAGKDEALFVFEKKV
jgi:hypothetical protein